jgi:hypothetical protein
MIEYRVICTPASGSVEIFPSIFPTLELFMEYTRIDASRYTSVEFKAYRLIELDIAKELDNTPAGL